jgi:hypothetical protein
VAGRSSGGAYLPKLNGWVWSDKNYLDLEGQTLDELPVLTVEQKAT